MNTRQKRLIVRLGLNVPISVILEKARQLLTDTQVKFLIVQDQWEDIESPFLRVRHQDSSQEYQLRVIYQEEKIQLVIERYPSVDLRWPKSAVDFFRDFLSDLVGRIVRYHDPIEGGVHRIAQFDWTTDTWEVMPVDLDPDNQTRSLFTQASEGKLRFNCHPWWWTLTVSILTETEEQRLPERDLSNTVFSFTQPTHQAPDNAGIWAEIYHLVNNKSGEQKQVILVLW